MAEPNWELLEAVLRQLQADVSEIKQKQVAHDKRFDAVDKQLRDIETEVTHSLGLGTASLTRMRVATDKVDDFAGRLEELTTRVKALEDAR